MVIADSDSQPAHPGSGSVPVPGAVHADGVGKGPSPVQAECVRCASCGFTEECTAAYIRRVRERWHGRWICGLCAEAVKYEAVKSGAVISIEEALNRHIDVCFRASSPPSPGAEHPISAMGRRLRRSLDSPLTRTAMRSNSSAAISRGDVDDVGGGHRLLRTQSCFPALSR